VAVLQIDKPRAESSASYIRRLSRLEPELKIGHCGTLDPMATGILLVCLNQMTRFASYLSSSEKTYQACISFGKKTSTGDSEGEIIESKEFSFLDFLFKRCRKHNSKISG
jgi:tRNA pseudouridine55 synthase